MAGRRLAGEAFAGEVTDVVMAYSEGKRPEPAPAGHRTHGRPAASRGAGEGVPLAGREAAGGGVRGVRGDEDGGAATGGSLVLRIVDKMGRGKEPEAGSVPEKGDLLCFTLFEHDQRGGAKLPDPEETPWTHGGPPGEPDAVPTADP